MQIIGITGSIYSGKSTVAGFFRKLGASVLDADKLGHRLIYKDKPAYRKLVRFFGRQILDARGAIRRKKLARLAFSGIEAQRKLRAAVHPELIAEIVRRIARFKQKYKTRVLCVEAALLIEIGLHRKMDKIILVRTQKKLQQERLKRTVKFKDEEVRKRLEFQLPEEQKIEFADYVVNNCGTFNDIEKKVNRLWRKLKNRG